MWILRLLTLLIALALATHASAQPDRRTDNTKLTIMAFNAEFLWDGVEPEEGSATFPWRGSPDEALEHMEAIAQVIMAHDPDIISLAEVENLEALDLLNTTFLAGRGYQAYLVDGTDSNTGQDVALLTRVDPEFFNRDQAREPIGDQTYGVSKNYYAKFTLGEMKFALVGLHFLAQPLNEDRQAQREAQARVIRNRAVTLTQEGYPPIVLGDFNDYDGELLDHGSHRPITTVLRTIRDMSPADQADNLLNVASRIPQAQRYTSWWDQNQNGAVDGRAELTSIDHILVSAVLGSRIQSVAFDTDHDPRRVSDHFPIVVTLKTPASEVVAETPRLRIQSLLPNPVGDEHQEEAATLVNLGTGQVNLSGWTLRDRARTAWELRDAGAVGSAPVVIRRQGQPMAMNNQGDTIDLVDPSGHVVHSVTYESTIEDELIEVALGEPAPREEPTERTAAPASSIPSTRIRIMAANLTSGNRQSYDPGHGIRIFKGLKPDIVLIQEFNYKDNTQADIQAFVSETFGSGFHSYREPGADIPNGVISRWPILQSGKWEDPESPNREFAFAKIDIPGSKDLWAVSTHLLIRSVLTRNIEAIELLNRLRADIPQGDYLVVGGDFNTSSPREAALITLDTVVDLTHQPTDHHGRTGTNASRRKPYDWVLPDDDLAPWHVAVQIGDRSFPSGLVFDSRVFEPLSLVTPVERQDSGAPQMQHMAIIKDFRVPVN